METVCETNEHSDKFPCPSKVCKRKGKCCKCVNFHRFEETDKLLYCFRERFVLKDINH